ncbi:MAG: glycosyltransferase family 2 protein, partial [Verrucomicrobiota bacterium]
MPLLAEDITIAVTVYSRREFVLEAIRSALNQTIPVRVMVVEDCGPDPTLRDLVTGEFGDRIQYFRNPRNRGLFDNWNACMEYCSTPWLSILHDDDILRPTFVKTMLKLSRQAPDRAIYFGRSAELTEQGQINPPSPVQWNPWREMDPIQLADECFVLFPGQLFNVAHARAVGSVRPRSFFTGDCDFWFRLVLSSGGAQTSV